MNLASPIILENVSKSYQRTSHKKRLSDWLNFHKRAERFWALRNVSFHVNPGAMLGVIGRNGAGKSSLLRLMGNVGKPDTGMVRTNGTVRALLDLSSGMHSDLTGVENTFFAGVVGGLTRKELQDRLDAIIKFAELEDFADDPVRTYSSGMLMRLAFSVAIHTDPDILLVDEVLAVGDISFQRKCLDRIRQLRDQGCAIVFVSHDAVSVRELCSEALWLRNGEMVAFGPAEEVVSQYVAEMAEETRARTPETEPSADPALKLGHNRFGSQELKILEVKLRNRFGQYIEELETGESLLIEIYFEASTQIESPVFNLGISNDERQDIIDINTDSRQDALPAVSGKGQLVLRLDRVDLKPGKYYVNVGAYKQNWEYAYDYHWHVYTFQIFSQRRQFGFINPPYRWSFGTSSQR